MAMPCTTTLRPGRADQASRAVCRFTCSYRGSSRVSTEKRCPSAPRWSLTRADTSFSGAPQSGVECTQSRKRRNALANSLRSCYGTGANGEGAGEPGVAGRDHGVGQRGAGGGLVEAVVAAGPDVQLADSAVGPDLAGGRHVLLAEQLRAAPIDERGG